MKDVIPETTQPALHGSQDAVRYKVRKEVVSKSYQDVKRDSESVSPMLKKSEYAGKNMWH